MFFLQSKVNASFYSGSNLTFVVRKTDVQVIMKLDRGIYGVVEVGAYDDHTAMVLCSWEDFFKKHFTNPDLQLAKFYTLCPKLGKALCGESEISFISGHLNAFGKSAPLKRGRFATMFLSDEIFETAQEVLRYNIEIRNEILTI